MKKRHLGKTNIEISEVGLGTWQLSGDVWGKKTEAEYIKAIEAAIDSDINYLDTALEYGNGYCEQVVGKALQGNSSVVISSKIPPQCDDWSPKPQSKIEDYFSSDWIVKCCETSLKNLRRECIDILFLHTWNLAWGHCTEWYEAMVKLKEQGKIRAIGISVGDRRAGEANSHIEGGRIDVVQVVYNILEQEPEYTLFPMAQKHQIGIIARCPFSSGALVSGWTQSQKFAQGDWRGLWTPDDWVAKQVEMVDLIKPIVKNINLSMSEIGLKYILNNQTVTSVIPGSSSTEHIRRNASVSAGLPHYFSEDILHKLQQLWLDGKIHGTYNGGA
ncbi:MAG: aldo/keto reductase [Okeania sp. SIO2C9]|uniref:aldo/keto reductase n=1 Tax=Okeania sp. SIO2C9 TaxID=2607791 RepID=UPI0013C02327|nr:aldo/keto reductase [Okeania sp. SIO2C9]NEQ76153.1 aldo/keto reductase [Okeania sp. SIO2C9]